MAWPASPVVLQNHGEPPTAAVDEDTTYTPGSGRTFSVPSEGGGGGSSNPTTGQLWPR